MKRHKQLWERICAFENITDAAREAMLGKRGKVAGARFFADWEREVVRLERELREGSYRPGAYHYPGGRPADEADAPRCGREETNAVAGHLPLGQGAAKVSGHAME